MNVAIIPARGGSKRIPRKNIKLFCGKPMIAWSIETALLSRCFDRVVVSTDDQEIGEVAREYGAETPFERPAELAGDDVATRPVIQHAIHALEAETGVLLDDVCCLYATAPLSQVSDLVEAQRLLHRSTELRFVFSIAEYDYPVQRSLVMDSSGRIEMRQPKYRYTRSQDLEKVYHDAGQFYFGKRDGFVNNVPTFSPASRGLLIPADRVRDIDTPEDWRIAEIMYRAVKR